MLPHASAEKSLGKAEMEFVSMDASLYLHKVLWSANRSTFNVLDILDFVTIEENTITSWLFTTKEGEVKSKAKKRWNLTSLIDRFTQSSANITKNNNDDKINATNGGNGSSSRQVYGFIYAGKEYL
jgi:hypothetical protein